MTRIAAVTPREGWGRIGILPAAAMADLDAIRDWGAAAVVTLVEAEELQRLGLHALGDGVRARGMDWLHWPIPDFGIPDAGFAAAWPSHAAALRGVLEGGRNVLIHCRGGLGRSGMIAARLLVEFGADPADAILRVREARSPHAIETTAQEEWVAARLR
ncbi:hypothetical protein [Muricoccus radiodurans]|uniref:phosphatase domain-containing putative toxin n=1 Tax=Muricoccus radiodurans TaxID=2231721 RepID=UPI003CEB9B6B